MLNENISSSTSSTVGIFNWITRILLFVGGLNWGLIGLFNFDLVVALFGVMSPTSRAIYVLVGIAALFQAFVWINASKSSN